MERNEDDTRLREALKSDKQIIVYRSSKQGKTALVSKHLPYDKNSLVSLTPKTSVVDIYHTILFNAGVHLTAGSADNSGDGRWRRPSSLGDCGYRRTAGRLGRSLRNLFRLLRYR